MRILFFSHYFPPEGNAPAVRVFQMARRWRKREHDVEVITGIPNVPHGKPYPGYRNRWHQIEYMEGIRVRRIWTYLAPNRGVARRSLNYFSYFVSAVLAGLCVRRPDVVVATSPQFLCGCAGAVVARLRRIPFVLEIRDLWPESIVAVGAIRKRLFLRVLERIERWLYRSARRVVTVGEGYRDELIARGVPASDIVIIPHGPDRDLLYPRPPDETIRTQYRLAEKFVCAYVGTIGMAAGLEVVLRAARILKAQGNTDIAFLLVGDGALREELEKRAAAERLTNVVFTGLQPKDRIPQFLSVADACLVHLRRQRLFQTVLPSKLLEAAAMAKPIVLGVEGYAARLLNEMKAGIAITPENEAELISALMELKSNPAMARAMGEAGHRFVVERFDLDKLAAQYEEVLLEVLAK